MRLDLLTLRLFVAVYEEASLTRAAMRENISLSALSKRLSDLEKSLKTVLFYRTKNRLTPTATARTLAAHVRRVMSDLDQLEVELSGFSMGVKGHIRIWSSAWAVLQYLPQDLASFMTAHPMLQIEIQESFSPAIVQAVADNVADIGIIGGNVLAPDLHVLPYRTERLVVVMWAGHPLAAKPSISFADMLQHDVIGPKRGSALDALLMEATRDTEAVLKIRIRVAGFAAICGMAAAKLGIGLVPEHAAQRYPNTETLTVRPLDEPWALRRLNLCVASLDALAPAGRLLLTHLQGHA